MWFKHRAWIPVAWLLCIVNVASVWFAAGEPAHATAHAVAAVLFGLGAQHLRLRRKPAGDPDVAGGAQVVGARAADQQMLEGVAGRLAELEDRLDFTERVLVDVRKRAQQPPKE